MQVEAYEKENAELKSRIKELESKLGIVSAHENEGNNNNKDAVSERDAASKNGGVVNNGAEMNLIDTSAEVLPLSPAPIQQVVWRFDKTSYERCSGRCFLMMANVLSVDVVFGYGHATL